MRASGARSGIHPVADVRRNRTDPLQLLWCDEGAGVVVAECRISRSQTVLLGSKDGGFSFCPETPSWVSFPFPECVGLGLHSGGRHQVHFAGIITVSCFCSVQNKLLSKGLSLTHPPASPSCLPSPDPAAASSPSTVDSVSPARKVVVLSN